MCWKVGWTEPSFGLGIYRVEISSYPGLGGHCTLPTSLDFEIIVVEEPTSSASFDLVFIHGLGGDPKGAWVANSANGDQFWPSWLAEAFPNARVLLLGYPTSKLGEMFGGTNMSFVTAAAGAADVLRSSQVGVRPAVFIVHSLGGLVLKALLRSCEQSTDSSLSRIHHRTAGAVFFGTPNTGSSLASVAKAVPQLASMQSMEIARGDAILLELATWFKGHAPHHNRVFYETVPMGAGIVVDAGSANPGLTGCDPVPIARDHVSMCKFENNGAAPFKSVLSFIRDDCGLRGSEDTEPDDLDYYLGTIDTDRRTLDEKLTAGGRAHDIIFAKREKERVAKSIQKNILYSSAKSQYKRSLGEINSRFQLHIRPLIERGASKIDVNAAIERHIIIPMVERSDSGSPLSTYEDVHAAIYYLTGNCHIDWSPE